MFFKNKESRRKADTAMVGDDMVTLKNGVMPAFLVKPNDPFSLRFFGKDQIEVSDTRCGYRIEMNGDIAPVNPSVTVRQGFEIDETHVYGKPGCESWYVIKTLKAPQVKTSSLRGSVEHPYEMSRMIGTPEPMVTIPEGFDASGYRSRGLVCMGTNPCYTQERMLDESIVYCHIFSFGSRLFKDFILCARKGSYSWKLEVVVRTESESIGPPDFVPPGYFFGSFHQIVGQ